MKRFGIFGIVILILTLVITGCEQKKASVLIIGDSISLGYTPFVQEELKEMAEVLHNPGNAQHTGTGLDSIQSWIGTENWDIIHFNWGLWDLCYRHPDSEVQGNRDKINGWITFELEDYGAQLDSIVQIMQQSTDAKLIFLVTTYVPEQEAGRHAEDAVRYNAVAKRIMQARGVIVHDIYEKSKQIHREYGKGTDDVHYLPEGYRELGSEVAAFLRQEMN
ncbi:MAG TPA: SGNH/GDSL hydrolase family protein [Saprospiraceae bacterium]|nr:SGNH/GDSL hydrolase family protein [Saprospiraceae bacterium]